MLFITKGDRVGRLVGTIVMEARPEPLVLIAREATLLSVLCARLALAGDTPVTASTSTDPRLDPTLRDEALLVIQSATLSCNPEEAVAMLRAQGWNGKLLLLVDRMPDHEPPGRVAWVDCRGGNAQVLAALNAQRG